MILESQRCSYSHCRTGHALKMLEKATFPSSYLCRICLFAFLLCFHMHYTPFCWLFSHTPTNAHIAKLPRLWIRAPLCLTSSSETTSAHLPILNKTQLFPQLRLWHHLLSDPSHNLLTSLSVKERNVDVEHLWKNNSRKRFWFFRGTLRSAASQKSKVWQFQTEISNWNLFNL